MEFFDRAYEGSPLWETGRPQPEFVRLEEEGEIVGRVLDVGCGTGETAIYLARRGHPVWGIDFAPNAIRKAKQKANERGVNVRFQEASALSLGDLGATFDTAIDSGLFHVFLDAHRPVYAENVRKVLVPGGRLYLLSFCEEEPTDWGGPRRVTQSEIREAFHDGWNVRSIRPARFEVTIPGVKGRAWLAELRRTPDAADVKGPIVRGRSEVGGTSTARGDAGPPRH